MSYDTYDEDAIGSALASALWENTTLKPNVKRASLEAIRERAAKAIEKAFLDLAEAEEREAQLPEEPPMGSVVRFKREFSKPKRGYGSTYLEPKIYDYAAIRCPRGWYLTGQTTGYVAWEDVAEMAKPGTLDRAYAYDVLQPRGAK